LTAYIASWPLCQSLVIDEMEEQVERLVSKTWGELSRQAAMRSV